MPHAAVTIDVDSLRCYREIHGLDGPPLDADPIYTVALPRFFDLLEAHHVPATLFLIGADAPAHADAFARVGTTGAEIASHSYDHDYRLSLRSFDSIHSDLARANEALAPLSPDGQVVGFRAPGYNTSRAMIEASLAVGHHYDSSMLPAPLYFAARAAAIGGYRLRGRRSASLVGEARAFAGPLVPYNARAATPWAPDPAGPVLELPMTVDPISRVPLIGTALTTFPSRLFDGMLRRALGTLPLVNLELHAIDLLDESDEGVPAALADVQRDLRVPWSQKSLRLNAVLETIRDAAEVVTLRDFAQRGASARSP